MSFGSAFSRALLGTAQQAGAAVQARRQDEDTRRRNAALMDLQLRQFEAQQDALRAAQQRQQAIDQREFAEGGYSAVDPLANASGRAMDAVPLPDMRVLAGMTMTQGRTATPTPAFTLGGKTYAKTGPSLREQEQQAARTERLTTRSQDAAARERERQEDAARRAAELATTQGFTAEQNELNRALQRQLLNMRAAMDAGGGQPTLRPAPAGVVSDVQGNMRQISVLDEALDAQAANPQATGFIKGRLPGFVLDNLPLTGFRDGVDARAAIADIGSMEIRDRSGAAVTAAEFPRLRPFIPLPEDEPHVVRRKLERMRDIIAQETAARASYYGPDNGYAPIVDPAAIQRRAPADPQRGTTNDRPSSRPLGVMPLDTPAPGGRPPLSSFVRP